MLLYIDFFNILHAPLHHWQMRRLGLNTFLAVLAYITAFYRYKKAATYNY